MNIKNKIIFSNIVIIVIPLLILLSIIGIFIKSTDNHYHEALEILIKDKNALYSAQSLMYEYKDEITSIYAENFSKNSKKELAYKQLSNLEKGLNNLGYNFSVEVDNNSLFDNMTKEEHTILRKSIKGYNNETNNLTLTEGDTSIILNTMDINGELYKITAIRMQNSKKNMNFISYIQKYILENGIVVILLYLIMIIVLNILLSHWISKSVLIPLEKLSEGSKKIKEGELDKPINYLKNDEFGQVCRDFDDMRGYLKDSVDERLRYENNRTQLLAGISHDLRTPLTSIKGYVEGLIDGIAKTPEMKIRYYRAIQTRANDMEVLLNNLSDYTHLESKSNNYYLEKVEINSYIKHLLKTYEIDFKRENVILNTTYLSDKVYVNMDTQKISRAILNIISNSIKYKVREQVVITINIGIKDNYVKLTIADDGNGVKNEDLEQIFECFYRGDASRTKPGEGSGLGLSITKKIVEMHNGKIEAKNENGLSIAIYIPYEGEINNEKNTNS
ncbi:ATP-binding protein [Intestinibacter sp.]|uniref:sensor histidine kinase n=1 Tax=Intestinibacter sp. TaxID=1965304 RepID=UPI003F14A55F